jgi:hypothetical protein
VQYPRHPTPPHESRDPNLTDRAVGTTLSG